MGETEREGMREGSPVCAFRSAQEERRGRGGVGGACLLKGRPA